MACVPVSVAADGNALVHRVSSVFFCLQINPAAAASAHVYVNLFTYMTVFSFCFSAQVYDVKMSYASTDINASPAMVKRGRCRSPGVNSKMSSSATPGTRCIVYLRRCLAIQLQKVGMFAAGAGGGNSATSCLNSNFDTTHERDAPLYWMYDSGYLIFQVIFARILFNAKLSCTLEYLLRTPRDDCCAVRKIFGLPLPAE